MKKLVVTLALAFAATTALAIPGAFTGHMEVVTTASGLTAWKCWYTASGDTYTLIFRDNCPGIVDIQ